MIISCLLVSVPYSVLFYSTLAPSGLVLDVKALREVGGQGILVDIMEDLTAVSQFNFFFF